MPTAASPTSIDPDYLFLNRMGINKQRILQKVVSLGAEV